MVRPPFSVLQGAAQRFDDCGDVAWLDMAASAGARRSGGWHPHEVTLDQLQRIQGGNNRVAHAKLLSPRMGRMRDLT